MKCIDKVQLTTTLRQLSNWELLHESIMSEFRGVDFEHEINILDILDKCRISDFFTAASRVKQANMNNPSFDYLRPILADILRDMLDHVTPNKRELCEQAIAALADKNTDRETLKSISEEFRYAGEFGKTTGTKEEKNASDYAGEAMMCLGKILSMTGYRQGPFLDDLLSKTCWIAYYHKAVDIAISGKYFKHEDFYKNKKIEEIIRKYLK